ncbi:MAG: hypothetical protein U5R31_16335 [Acidimicrobiia bacterium]|nr:hypothetical protein [Acidimicrobiia bacterium]
MPAPFGPEERRDRSRVRRERHPVDGDVVDVADREVGHLDGECR